MFSTRTSCRDKNTGNATRPFGRATLRCVNRKTAAIVEHDAINLRSSVTRLLSARTAWPWRCYEVVDRTPDAAVRFTPMPGRSSEDRRASRDRMLRRSTYMSGTRTCVQPDEFSRRLPILCPTAKTEDISRRVTTRGGSKGVRRAIC